jgi:mono/diheme cytochrome c family protein
MKLEPGMAYNTKKLNKLFAVLSVLFFITIIWVFLDDYIKPWKVVQIKSLEIKRQVLSEQVAEEDKNIDQEKLKELKSKAEVEEKNLAQKNDAIKNAQEEQKEIDKQIYSQNMINGEMGSLAAEWQYKYEHYNTMKGKEKNALAAQKQMQKYKALFDEGRDRLKQLQADELRVQNTIKSIQKESEVIQKSIKDLVGAKERLLAAAEKSELNPIWFLRNAPFIDYLDPTIKIQQIVLNNIVDDRYFQKTAKVDRCTTCHVFIDQKGFEAQPNPYKTHPKLDTLAVGQDSAHPKKEFGCTTCHGGEGHRVLDFQSVAHTPQNLAQKKEWQEKYNWHEPHKVPSTMLPLQHTEASCIKCHQGEDRLVFGEKHNKGRELIENYGCYGCHKIQGWEHYKKPGPSLEKIVGKLTSEFTKNWIWSPHTFNPHSRMPAFFSQANNSKEEFAKLNIVEVNAMTEYLYAKSKDYQPTIKYVGGNADKGKELIQTIGCVGCHQVAGIDEPYSNVKSLKGPYLVNLGSKLDKDWLVTWLLKPSHYQEDTVMPSFRLSNQEANDIAAFLLASKNKTFEQLKFASIDLEKVDQLLVEYFSAFDPIAVAQKQVAQLSEKEKVLELGKRSLSKYGCYSCHNISGFDDLPPIGPELSAVGSKFVDKFGWGHQHHLEKNRHTWLFQHLKQPSIWDIGVPKPFKDLNKMPNFYLSDDEATVMTTYLLGLVDEFIPMTGKRNLPANRQVALEGKKVANKYNCQGCHVIDGVGGTINAAFADDQNAGPPWLVVQGHRVYSEWLYNFLQNVYTIRPYMTVRMPSFNFTNDELNKLVAYFQLDANQITFAKHQAKVEWEPGEREAAQKMFQELACTSCHTVGFTNEKAQGPDLRQVKLRLRETWIKEWLLNPQAIMPYTPMPNFWDGGKASAVPGVLGDDPQKQIQAMTKYLFEMSQNSYPQPISKQ